MSSSLTHSFYRQSNSRGGDRTCPRSCYKFPAEQGHDLGLLTPRPGHDDNPGSQEGGGGHRRDTVCQVKAGPCTLTLEWNCLEPSLPWLPKEFWAGAPSPSRGGNQEGRYRASAGSPDRPSVAVCSLHCHLQQIQPSVTH